MAELRSVDELLSMPIDDMLATATNLELQMVREAQIKGNSAKGYLHIRDELDREKALDSPSFFATEIVDSYYKENFERIHYEVMDEVCAPYLLGDSFKLEGVTYDPKDFIGFIIMFSRDTFKSSMCRLLLFWLFLYTKLRLNNDTRAMYCHQVLDKAIKAGGAIRATARMNKRFRQIFPEFQGPQGEWDTKQEWCWPNFTSRQATEFSFTAYGETSDKTGGHYTARFVDDWETEKSVTNPTQIEQSIHNFKAMDPLRDRTVDFCPYLIPGTTYHHQGLLKTLENEGGYLIWKVPAHTGSSKAIFDLCALDPRNEKDRRKIKLGIKKLEKERPEDLNFPKRLPWRELLASARGQGPRIYACQMLLNPTPEGDTRFDHAALDESWEEEIPYPQEMHIYIRCDPAISEKKDADETAIIVGGIKWDAKRYLIDGWMGREKQPNKIVLKTFDFAAKWQAKGYKVINIGFESVAFQKALQNMARYGVGERAASYDGESVPMRTKPCPVRGIERSADRTKHERILEMDGPITRRELKFWTKCSIAEKVMNQFKNFPYDKDDGLDATHDLWVGTYTPAPPMNPQQPAWPVAFKEFKKPQYSDSPMYNRTVVSGGW